MRHDIKALLLQRRMQPRERTALALPIDRAQMEKLEEHSDKLVQRRVVWRGGARHRGRQRAARQVRNG